MNQEAQTGCHTLNKEGTFSTEDEYAMIILLLQLPPSFPHRRRKQEFQNALFITGAKNGYGVIR